MGKSVTFSFRVEQTNSEVVETFSFPELGLNGEMDDIAMRKVVAEVFREWVWSKISYSYIIEDESEN